MKRKIDDARLKKPLLLPNEGTNDDGRDVKPGKKGKVETARTGAAQAIRAQVEGLVKRVAKRKRDEHEVTAPEPRTVRFCSGPELRAPLNFKHLLGDLMREARAIEALPVQGDRIAALEALWGGVTERLLSALAPGRSDETDRRRALAVILLASHHASFEKFARKGNAAAFADRLGSLHEAMDTASPDSFWQGAELEAVLRGLLRISMHAGSEEDIARRALEMLDTLCHPRRVSSELRTAMTHLTEAAQLAWFNLDGVWERSAELVENVVDELKKLGPPKG
jgi:hypothetical protein